MYFAMLSFEGDDELELTPASELLRLFNNFGSGTDSFDDQHATIFPIANYNLP